MQSVSPQPRVLGIDDAPFQKEDVSTLLTGVLYRGDQAIEQVTATRAVIDGNDAAEAVQTLVSQARTAPNYRTVLRQPQIQHR
jgi:endonuclease V-like protein UPF0215 family